MIPTTITSPRKMIEIKNIFKTISRCLSFLESVFLPVRFRAAAALLDLVPALPDPAVSIPRYSFIFEYGNTFIGFRIAYYIIQRNPVGNVIILAFYWENNQGRGRMSIWA